MSIKSDAWYNVINAPHIEGNVIAGNNLLPCITFMEVFIGYEGHCPWLKLNFLSFDTKHDILWTMFKGQ